MITVSREHHKHMECVNTDSHRIQATRMRNIYFIPSRLEASVPYIPRVHPYMRRAADRHPAVKTPHAGIPLVSSPGGQGDFYAFCRLPAAPEYGMMVSVHTAQKQAYEGVYSDDVSLHDTGR